MHYHPVGPDIPSHAARMHAFRSGRDVRLGVLPTGPQITSPPATLMGYRGPQIRQPAAQVRDFRSGTEVMLGQVDVPGERTVDIEDADPNELQRRMNSLQVAMTAPFQPLCDIACNPAHSRYIWMWTLLALGGGLAAGTVLRSMR